MTSTNAVADIGQLGLLGALVACAYAVGGSVAGARRGSQRLVRSALAAAHAATALVVFASAILWFGILVNDYSIKYVQRTSDATMPWYYKVSSFWGGLDGSIMWWVLLLAVFSSVAIFLNRQKHRELIPYVTAVLFTVVGFFLFFIIYEKRPFDVYLTEAPALGKGMNPLLQNPYMATHPPSLYLGFVSATVPFAFGIAALITGNLDDSWIHSTRRWMLVSWYFLSQGLILGMLWSYEELGWGGYWAWDAVENAALIPWFTATAFLHSIVIQERRGMLKVWNVCLVIITFILTIVGTFLTRSGVVASVHAFGQDHELAVIFLCFIGAITVFSFGWVIYRLPLLSARNELDSWLSREFAFLINNWILLSAAFFVLVATLFPSISEGITGERITVGPPFFNKWMTPIGLVLLFLTGTGPLIAWRKSSAANLRQQLLSPAVFAVVVTIGLALIPGLRVRSAFISDKIQIPVSLICFGLSAYVFGSIFQEFYRGSRVRQSHTKLGLLTSFVGLVARGKRRYGGYVVHLGVALMFIGFAGGAYKKESDVTLERGQSATIGSYSVRFDRLVQASDIEKDIVSADVVVSTTAGQELGRLSPAKWAFRRHKDEPPTTEVDIQKSAREDLYVVLNGYDYPGMANLKLVINPLVSWIWIGFLLLAIGSFIAYLPDRAYAMAGVTVPADRSASAATAVVLLLLLCGGRASAQSADQQAATLPPSGVAEMPSLVGTELHSARNESERQLFAKLRCTCSCLHNLTECGSECGPGAERRQRLQQLLDRGVAPQQIIEMEVGRYGQWVLQQPIDRGFNRLAWAFPYAVLLTAVGGLVIAGRRWTGRRHAAEALVPPEHPEIDDAHYARKLEDELDEND